MPPGPSAVPGAAIAPADRTLGTAGSPTVKPRYRNGSPPRAAATVAGLCADLRAGLPPARLQAVRAAGDDTFRLATGPVSGCGSGNGESCAVMTRYFPKISAGPGLSDS
ncbi:hypothetical protein KNE206_38930 [Kitasatospora sp. NE20-6]